MTISTYSAILVTWLNTKNYDTNSPGRAWETMSLASGVILDNVGKSVIS